MLRKNERKQQTKGLRLTINSKVNLTRDRSVYWDSMNSMGIG